MSELTLFNVTTKLDKIETGKLLRLGNIKLNEPTTPESKKNDNTGIYLSQDMIGYIIPNHYGCKVYLKNTEKPIQVYGVTSDDLAKKINLTA